MAIKKNDDQISGSNNKKKIETTGHEWDGIEEYNTPVPRWWSIVFIACIIFSVVYLVLYPAIPTISGKGTRGATEGVLKWTEYKQLKESQQEIVDRRKKYLEDFHKKSNEEVLSDPKLYEFAVVGGKSAFKDNCITCHGSDASGRKGYPNLNDNDWIRGGTIDEIYNTLKKGIRSDHKDTFVSSMPVFGEILKGREITQVVDYVLSLSSKDKKTFPEGEVIFKNNCVSCHGDDAKGRKEFGAPNLTDAIWLYGGTREDVYSQVNTPQHGVMPAWEGKLSNDTIRQLSIYVYSLGARE